MLGNREPCEKKSQDFLSKQWALIGGLQEGTEPSFVYCERGWIETVSWSPIRESLTVA